MGEAGVGGKPDVDASCDAGDAMEACRAPSHAAVPADPACRPPNAVGAIPQSLVVFWGSWYTFGDQRRGPDVSSCEMCRLSVRFCSIRPDLALMPGVFTW